MPQNSYLYVVVSVAGAAVLAIEILGTRVLGPFYGVSLFLWSALITATLAALSLGYWLGGRWADAGPRPARLGALLAAAGAWLLLVPWIRQPVLAHLEPLGLRAAVLVAASVLFVPPLALLGMVTPYAVRLAVSNIDHVGRTAGNLFAVSTIASVLSALATGFFLIPNVGVSRLLLLVGCVLQLGAAVAFLAGRARRPAAAAGIAAGLVLAAAAARFGRGPAAAPAGGDRLLAVRESPYAEIEVRDWKDFRYLLIDGGTHTIVQPGTWTSRHRYVAALEVTKFLFPGPGRLAVVGLGGGSVVKNFARDGWSVDAVEIDPAVTAVAREYFGLASWEARVIHMDGRRFLRTATTAYDLIVLDAYGSSAIPFHLVTRECFQLAAARLAPAGVLAINVESVGWRDPIVAAVAATLSQVFSQVVALPTAEPPDALGNVVLLAGNRDLEFPEERLERPFDFLADPQAHWTVVQKNHAWLNRFQPDKAGAMLLTDDRNPVDLWAERINLVARRKLHELFAARPAR
jgi:spermidine synthase